MGEGKGRVPRGAFREDSRDVQYFWRSWGERDRAFDSVFVSCFFLGAGAGAGWCGRVVFVSGSRLASCSFSEEGDADADADADAEGEVFGGIVYPSLADWRRSFAVVNFGVEVVVWRDFAFTSFAECAAAVGFVIRDCVPPKERVDCWFEEVLVLPERRRGGGMMASVCGWL